MVRQREENEWEERSKRKRFAVGMHLTLRRVPVWAPLFLAADNSQIFDAPLEAMVEEKLRSLVE
jgi:hypothetical protein